MSLSCKKLLVITLLILGNTACGAPEWAASEFDMPVEESEERSAEAIDFYAHFGEVVERAWAGDFTALFSHPEGQCIFATLDGRRRLRLFQLCQDRSWAEVELPAELRGRSDMMITSLVAGDDDLMFTTLEHGAWLRVDAESSWRSFTEYGFDESGKISRLRRVGEEIYAYFEIDPAMTLHIQDGLELWQRSENGWSFLRNDMFMIIDYLPRDEMLLRSTHYGTVDISHDGGEHWWMVPGIFGMLPPKLVEWGEAVLVVTTDGVWSVGADVLNWEKISAQGGQDAVLVGDELILSNGVAPSLSLSLLDGAVRPLPALPAVDGEEVVEMEMAALGSTLLVSRGGPQLLQLSHDQSRWEPVRFFR